MAIIFLIEHQLHPKHRFTLYYLHLNVRELLVPINKNNAHWLLLRVDLEKFEIWLWDSVGPDQNNRRYLQNMIRYLYDVYQCLHPDSHHTREAWHDQWTLIDDSGNCPLQENSYDCGIFTLVNMALIAQGVVMLEVSELLV